MGMCRCSKCKEIIDTEYSEGELCEDCRADLDSMDLEDQIEELLK